MRNVEIKARVKNLYTLRQVAESLSGTPPQILKQTDTFYNARHGRLKMRRQVGDKHATLVQYHRPDQCGPKLSQYTLVPLEPGSAKELDQALQAALGVAGVLHKTRFLYMVGQTRVHLDQVKDLGDFMELEVVLTDDQTEEEGRSIAQELQKKLGIQEDDLLHCAYMDLVKFANITGEVAHI